MSIEVPERFNILMTRGAGWLWCSGILLNAGPLVRDRGFYKRERIIFEQRPQDGHVSFFMLQSMGVLLLAPFL